MIQKRHVPAGIVACAAVATLLVPVAAQQRATAGPTKENPMRLRAVIQSQGKSMGLQGVVQISIERWTTDAERQSLLALLAGPTVKAGEQGKLLNGLKDIKPRAGYLKLPNSPGWDIQYARENAAAGGMRQIVVVTDRPVSFSSSFNGAESTDYPFTLIEMHLGQDNKGEGAMLTRSAISAKDGRLQLENYGVEPIKLTEITPEK
jgi:hypothetical protein